MRLGEIRRAGDGNGRWQGKSGRSNLDDPEGRGGDHFGLKLVKYRVQVPPISYKGDKSPCPDRGRVQSSREPLEQSAAHRTSSRGSPERRTTDRASLSASFDSF